MAYLRWIHKSWNIFWTFIGVLVLTVALIFGAIVGLMQLQIVKDRVALEIEKGFSREFEGVLKIGKLDGLLPLNIELSDVKVYPDSTVYKPVLEAKNITANIDIKSLLQNQLVIKTLLVQDPTSIFDTQSDFTAERAFRLKSKQDPAFFNVADEIQGLGYQIIIPSANIESGNVIVRNAFPRGNQSSSSDSLQFLDIDMLMFFEYTREQRFMDIDRIQFQVPELDIPEVELYGQIYNDSRFLELNAINLKSGNSSIRFNGVADGVNFLKGNLPQQLLDSSLDILVDRFSVEPALIARLAPNAPDLPVNLEGSLKGEGTLDSLYFSKAEFLLGESFAIANGYVNGLRKNDWIKYNANLEALIIAQSELKSGRFSFSEEQEKAVASTRFEGNITGNLDTTRAEIKAIGERGDFEINGKLDWGEQTAYNFVFQADSLDLGNLIDPRITKTELTFSGALKNSSMNFMEGQGGLVINSAVGTIENKEINQLSILANWEHGFIEPDVRLSINGSRVTSNGWINLRGDLPVFSLQGSARQIYLQDIIQDESFNKVWADLEYDVNLTGFDFDEIHGQLSLDILEAIAGNDTLGRHQLYFDLNEPASQKRMLRFTSTAFDATVEGIFQPSELIALFPQWESYFENRVREEILFDTHLAENDSAKKIANQSLVISARMKNLGLLHSYIPGLPVVESLARINSTVNINSDRLLFNGTLIDSKTKVYDFSADSLILQITGGFRREAKLKEFSGLQFRAQAAKINYNYLKDYRLELSADLNQDSIGIRNTLKKIGDETSLAFDATGKLLENSLYMNLLDFNMGSKAYRWVNKGMPVLRYNSNGNLTLKDFIFESEEQFVEINGTYSNSPDDSVNYNIERVDLQVISQMIGGRLNFGGLLNGKFTTRTLTTVPTIQGDIDVEALTLDGTLFGDIVLSSKYNSISDRFDTNIKVSTDSLKYPEYYANNDRRGQDFNISGYLMAPVEGNFPDVDSLYRFDLNFKNIDLWILPYLGPRIFAEGSGLANGTGKIWGNLNDFDFSTDFYVGVNDAAYLRPRFLDTYYYGQGKITFTRHDGFTFHDIYFIDPSGGNATLSGYYDLNGFASIDTMDIRLEMNEFQFLNSTFDPSLAFFGAAYGSSTVTITGTNINPVLSTVQPIVVSDFSEISIPLLEETEFDEDNRFIRFVDSFDASDIQNGTFSPNLRGRLNILENNQMEDRSFAEIFTMDLQFVANDPMTVRLIFDPVTGDIVTAGGTGRLRILLEDEQVSMFGRFDIQGGRYQFVSGDIFTRRFELESGGTILWEGDPENARLNLNAFYSARPDINTLSNTGTRDPDNTQRVPVDLVLNIGGTISSIENNFFFRLPSTFESQQSSTLSTQLASINRDENLKLIQAANFMLMGDFIPVSSTGEAQSNLLSDNLSGSAAVLNPLISSQVINPLLSNQVNSLLNSDLSSLDVDFNLNTYNQVDLGVALRLYNDKLILRREGQITGRQSNIGDLGATYQINRTFALTAFHRQDLAFGTLNSTEQSQQSQDINGVGLEAKVSFNTWQEFFNRLFSPFRKLFGIQEEDEQEQEEITENRQGNNPA